MSDLRSEKKDITCCGSFYSCLNFIFLCLKLNTSIIKFQRKSLTTLVPIKNKGKQNINPG